VLLGVLLGHERPGLDGKYRNINWNFKGKVSR